MGFGLPESRLEICLRETGTPDGTNITKNEENDKLTDCLNRRAYREHDLHPQCSHIVYRKYPKASSEELVRHIRGCMNASLKKHYTQLPLPPLPPNGDSSTPSNLPLPESTQRPKRRGEGKPNYFSDRPRYIPPQQPQSTHTP